MESNNLDMSEKIIGWLEKEGYRLEYMTHKAFRDAGFTANIGEYFMSAEGKLREIDVTAFIDSHQVDSDEKVRLVRVMCECKYSKDNPWVMMTTGLTSDFFADWISLPKSLYLSIFNVKVFSQFQDFLQTSWHFAEKQIFCTNLIQALRKNNRDVAFDSLQKIYFVINNKLFQHKSLKFNF